MEIAYMHTTFQRLITFNVEQDEARGEGCDDL